MFLIFFKKCGEFVGKIFELLFCNPNERLEKLHNMQISDWKQIMRPTISESGVLYLFSYENKMVKDILYYIKNKNDHKLVENLTKVISDTVLEELAEKELMENFTNPIIISIPTSSKQKNRRGFNPSELLAIELAKNLNIPHIKNALNKIKNTRPQKTLSRKERLVNVVNSIETNPNFITKQVNKSIIVVDDITTTGATLKEARRALIKSGFRNIMCVAVAH